MTKTLKYKTMMKNNTRKYRGGIGINLFGKYNYGNHGSSLMTEPKITELPFMYFYDIQSNTTETKESSHIFQDIIMKSIWNNDEINLENNKINSLS